MHKPDEEETEDEIVEYEKTAIKFQNQFRGMMNKYQHLLMKESMVSFTKFSLKVQNLTLSTLLELITTTNS